jgi:hypothetical protein
MPRPETERFMAALQEAEANRDPERLVDLFGPDATLSNLTLTEQGTDGARRFWSKYRQQFDDVHSEFDGVIEDADRSVLLWNSSAPCRMAARLNIAVSASSLGMAIESKNLRPFTIAPPSWNSLR